jgi:hypothetical protein
MRNLAERVGRQPSAGNQLAQFFDVKGNAVSQRTIRDRRRA